MSEPTIKINPTKSCDIEFEVSVQGSEMSETPIVRLVLNGCDDYLTTFECTKGEGSKWSTKLPPLTHCTRTTIPFHVEVIVDGYYFEPAEGTVQLITNPAVMFPSAGGKPTVTTSFTVHQEEDEPEDKKATEPPAKKATDEPKKDEEDEQITGQYAPTNGLLKPEYAPPQSHVKTPNAEKDDQHIDMSKLASHVVPGETTDPEPQDDGKDEGDEVGFDPARIAEQIVRSTVDQIEKPTSSGVLFRRRADGSPIVEGIDTSKDAAAKRAKASRVKEILGKK